MVFHGAMFHFHVTQSECILSFFLPRAGTGR